MAKTYNISSEWYDSLLTINKQGYVTGATSPLQSAKGKHITEIEKRSNGKAKIYNECDTLDLFIKKNCKVKDLIDKLNLEEY
jgi:hypothetical protein